MAVVSVWLDTPSSWCVSLWLCCTDPPPEGQWACAAWTFQCEHDIRWCQVSGHISSCFSAPLNSIDASDYGCYTRFFWMLVTDAVNDWDTPRHCEWLTLLIVYRHHCLLYDGHHSLQMWWTWMLRHHWLWMLQTPVIVDVTDTVDAVDNIHCQCHRQFGHYRYYWLDVTDMVAAVGTIDYQYETSPLDP